ncbi:hypothetical protein CspeluHIS016_0701290 [Cutaneotrichosporon spelunceum]|uniref:Deacetylase sirtuin-type domain-containing protein n=1 Tax=Cutaneotrichosporon spelunceum TaxID=1672016 RepID=A0AAD3TYD1_9TREE|nr:hypothetical protein CspeluHIS016_0701290 [Cutaneotrichosporon spelunceum]
MRFAEPSTSPEDDLCAVVRRIRSAKRIVVVCGAGVSTAASIPDFRGSNGLFARGSVKDLFHVKSLTSPHLLSEHHALLSNLNRLAGEAQPTAFHLFLRDMDREGRLLRVYTQNIDGLEERAGLKTGIPSPKRLVLYGEEHPQGEAIGSMMERDLRGTGPRGEREGRADLLLVAGTSLSIPGVKRMVKEMAKSLASRSVAGRSGRGEREPLVRVVYVNAEPPAKPAEWEGVFDVWARGDVQDLAALVGDTSFAPTLPKIPKTPRRKKTDALPTPNSGTARKRKTDADDDTPTKRPLLLTPASTPRKSRSSSLPSPSPVCISPSPPPRPVFVAQESQPVFTTEVGGQPVKADSRKKVPKQRTDAIRKRKHPPSPSPEMTPTKPKEPVPYVACLSPRFDKLALERCTVPR